MRISVADFAGGALAPLSPTVQSSPDKTLYCSNIRFWDGSYDPDCLYIGRASELSPEPPKTDGRFQIQLLLVADAPIPEAYLNHPSTVIISFPADTDPQKLFNAISDSGFCLPRYAIKLTELLEPLSVNDFPGLAERVQNVLGRPVYLLTPGLRLLAGSEPDIIDPFVSRIQEKLRGLGLTGRMGPVMYQRDERRLWPIEDYPHEAGVLFLPIVHQGELFETLGYICCPDIPQADASANLSALFYISRLLVPSFLRFVREDRTDSAAFSLLLGRIISGELKDDGIIAAVLDRAGIVLPQHMVLVTVLSETFSTEDLYACAGALGRGVWPHTRAALVDNQVVLLIGRDELPVIRESELSLLETQLDAFSCTAGISEPFHIFDKYLRNYFHRSFCAAVVARLRGGKRTGTYGESALYHLSSNATNMAAISSFKDAFVDANLMRLIEYDAAHGTNHLTTLRCYWHYNRNSAAICRYLHIQRSTLFYRLSKVREILEKDYNDYTNLVSLSVGISILETLGLIPTLSYSESPPAPGKSGREEQ